ncbi:hypothetical protein K2X30_00040 [bacterium]|jgi:hypothetical protein|nr:hypothetical protein [bacterium]
MMNKQLLAFATATLFLALPARAEKFANQFVEFELPPQWTCSLEGAEWVCQGTAEAKKRDAIIVLAAKLKGDQDSIDQYLSYLKAAKTYTSIQGKPVKSQVKTAESKNLNNQVWVDSLHLESEIPGFYTRYLATVKQDIGVLVTYSVNKDKYAQYLKDFDNMVRTLRVYRKEGGLNVAPQKANLFEIPQAVTQGTVFPTVNPQGGSTEAPKVQKAAGDNSMMLILIVVGVLAFIIWKRKQRGG